MKTRSLLTLFLFSLCLTNALAQDKPQNVLVDADPPLTQQMVDDYEHFMQWSLRTPLTVSQQSRIQSFLVDNWKANNKAEITRTLNILALRQRMADMGLQDSRWAAYQTGENALSNWNSSNSLEMARWGLALFNSSHKPLVAGDPPLTRQMEDAYEEMGYFVLNIVDGVRPNRLDAVERAQLADALASSFPQMSADSKANFALLPKIWVQIRTAWPTLDDPTKASLRNLWKSKLYPAAGTTKGGAKKAVEPTINRLVGLTWMLKPDVWDKMTAVGTPYGLGW